MRFLRYLIFCISEAVTLGLGRSDIVTEDSNAQWIGLLCVAIIIAIFSIFTLIVFRKKKNAVLYGLLVDIGFIIVFCGLSIIIEAVIRKS